MTTLELTGEAGTTEPLNHQEKLADLLVQNLGYDGAVQACRANLWAGVLTYVLAHKGPQGTDER